MTVQELFNDIPLWQVAHILPHEAAQIVAEWLHEETDRRNEVEIHGKGNRRLGGENGKYSLGLSGNPTGGRNAA